MTVDATRVGSAARFLNHSCAASLHSLEVDVPTGPSLILVHTVRAVAKGEELCLDYCPEMTRAKLAGKSNRVRCACGEPAGVCRFWTL